jgi:hypothetical protein
MLLATTLLLHNNGNLLLLLPQIIVSNLLPLLNISKMVKTLEQATEITLAAIKKVLNHQT